MTTPRPALVLALAGALALAGVSSVAWAASDLESAMTPSTGLGALALLASGAVGYLQWSRNRTEAQDKVEAQERERAALGAKIDRAVQTALMNADLRHAQAQRAEDEAEARRIAQAIETAVAPLRERIADQSDQIKALLAAHSETDRRLTTFEARAAITAEMAQGLRDVQAMVARLAGTGGGNG